MPEICAIHQPNFFPWLGYFHRIAQVDRFVFFDHVAMPGGRSIVQRVKVVGPQGPTWLTMPVEKSGKLGQRICEVRLREPAKNFAQLLAKLQAYYRTSPHFEQVYTFVKEMPPETEFLGHYNRQVIEAISRKLGLSTQFVTSSSSGELMESKSVRTEMILQTCEAFGVQNYMSGKGCLEFLEKDAFETRGIALTFQEFHHPEYHQETGSFVSGLSLLDALFHVGFSGTKELIGAPTCSAAI
jgi:hypothetical protein